MIPLDQPSVESDSGRYPSGQDPVISQWGVTPRPPCTEPSIQNSTWGDGESPPGINVLSVDLRPSLMDGWENPCSCCSTWTDGCCWDSIRCCCCCGCCCGRWDWCCLLILLSFLFWSTLLWNDPKGSCLLTYIFVVVVKAITSDLLLNTGH